MKCAFRFYETALLKESKQEGTNVHWYMSGIPWSDSICVSAHIHVGSMALGLQKDVKIELDLTQILQRILSVFL